MEAAKKSNRTFGAEVVMRLETSFRVDSIQTQAEDVVALTTANAERTQQALLEMRELKAAMEKQLEEAREYLVPPKTR